MRFIALHNDLSRALAGPVADFDCNSSFIIRRFAGDPVYISGNQFGAAEFFEAAYYNPVGDGIYLNNIQAPTGTDAHTLSLAHGVKGQALMRAQQVAPAVYYFSGLNRYPFGQKGFLVIGGNETDILALPVFGLRQPRSFGQFFHLGLVQTAQRKLGIGQYSLIENV
jgi:hypothetical protein